MELYKYEETPYNLVLPKLVDKKLGWTEAKFAEWKNF